MATMIDSDLQKPAGVQNEAVLEVESPVQLAYTSAPALQLTGTVSVIRSGRRDLALSDEEWRDLGLGMRQMPNDADWYEVVQGDELMQGDLLMTCPVPRVRGFEQWPVPAGQPVEVEVYLEDLVILSHSCV